MPRHRPDRRGWRIPVRPVRRRTGRVLAVPVQAYASTHGGPTRVAGPAGWALTDSTGTLATDSDPDVLGELARDVYADRMCAVVALPTGADFTRETERARERDPLDREPSGVTFGPSGLAYGRPTI